MSAYDEAYNARWYDPHLGRFTQPDTIVPNPTDAKAFDRYAYVYNNPVRYNDPSGHVCSDPEDPTPSCDGSSKTVVGSKVIQGKTVRGGSGTSTGTDSNNNNAGTGASAEPDETLVVSASAMPNVSSCDLDPACLINATQETSRQLDGVVKAMDTLSLIVSSVHMVVSWAGCGLGVAGLGGLGTGVLPVLGTVSGGIGGCILGYATVATGTAPIFQPVEAGA